MGKQRRDPIVIRIAPVARAILRLQTYSDTSACALNVDLQGFIVQPAPDTERPWLAVGYTDFERGSKRAADRAARRLINQCAAHLRRYPNLFDDTIVTVREG